MKALLQTEPVSTNSIPTLCLSDAGSYAGCGSSAHRRLKAGGRRRACRRRTGSAKIA
jgi:hypothetical protein